MNGNKITKGEVITSYGTLVIAGGQYNSSFLTLYNDGIAWSPTRTYGNNLEYSLTSNGIYELRDVGDRTLFKFSVDVEQDFNIVTINDFNQGSAGFPGPVVSTGHYWQVEYKSKSAAFTFWVRGDLRTLRELDLRATGGARVDLQTPGVQYYDYYARLLVDMVNVPIGGPVSIYVGNVLVLYIVKTTA